MFDLFHVNYQAAHKTLEAVKGGFLAWGLLALSMGIIFLSILVLNRIARKKDKKAEKKDV